MAKLFIILTPYYITQVQSLVFYNLLISFLVLGALFFYRYIYPRKKMPLFIILIIIATLPLFSIWRKGVPESGDFAFFVKSLISFYGSLEKGIFRPQWGAEFCGSFGKPFFKYFYNTLFYIASSFHFFGLSFINSMKMLSGLIFLFSGATMFFWLKEEFGKKPAFVGTVVYLFAPYQLVNLHFKHAFGEGLGFVLAPLLFLIAKKTLKSKSLNCWIIFIATYSFFILSHHITPILTTPLLLIYLITQIRLQKKYKLKTFLSFLLAMMISILLTFFHWMPLIFENGLIQQSQMTQIQFHPLTDFIFSKWRYGLLFQGHYGELSPLIGYTQLLIILLGIILFCKKKLSSQDKSLLGVSLAVFFSAFFIMQSFSSNLWQIIPLLNSFQFSTRFLFVVVLLSGVITAIVVKNLQIIFPINNNLKNKIVISFTLVTIMYTILNWGTRGMISNVTDEISRAQLLSTTSRCDQLLTPAWVDYYKFKTLFKDRKTNLDLLSGEAKLIELNRTPHKHEYLVYASSDILLKENTTYFPNWKATDNNQEVVIDYQHKQFPGLIVIKLKPGTHFLTLKFTKTKAERCAEQLSLLTLLIGIFIYLVKIWQRR